MNLSPQPFYQDHGRSPYATGYSMVMHIHTKCGNDVQLDVEYEYPGDERDIRMTKVTAQRKFFTGRHSCRWQYRKLNIAKMSIKLQDEIYENIQIRHGTVYA